MHLAIFFISWCCFSIFRDIFFHIFLVSFNVTGMCRCPPPSPKMHLTKFVFVEIVWFLSWFLDFFSSYFLDFFYVTRTWRSHLLLRWTSQSVCRSGFFVTWKCSASFWYRCHCLIGFGLLINKIDNLMIKYRIASIRLWMRICWNAVYF